MGVFNNVSRHFLMFCRRMSSQSAVNCETTAGTIEINEKKFIKDKWSNVTPSIMKHFNANLHLQPGHPLSLLRQSIVNFMYKTYMGNSRSPLFSVYERLSPIVTVEQNFDSLLIPETHPSRKPSDCYYINQNYVLRGHTSAHQKELISMGLDNFLVIGDVYRRDEIDSSHYPVFHQMEGVRLFNKFQLFRDQPTAHDFDLFENGPRTVFKQECHTLEAAKLLEYNLKTCLTQLVQHLFGNDTETRWTETYFPFTHPSFELEVKYQEKWLELLGCGIIEQKLLQNAGVTDKVGWAFGLGLERIAMRVYDIPDIRLFWSKDTGFLSQFEAAAPDTKIKFKPFSQYPQCINDISFWLPDGPFSSNDFYDIVRSIGGEVIEQVRLIDEFVHPKTQRRSHCYRIVYRHMQRTLSQEEVNIIHKQIEVETSSQLNVTIR